MTITPEVFDEFTKKYNRVVRKLQFLNNSIIRRATDINIIKSHKKANELFNELINNGFRLNKNLVNIDSKTNNSKEQDQHQNFRR